MTTGIRSGADGSKSYISIGGTDVVTLGTQGIEAGSFKPGAIAANDFADGALIENSVNGIGYGPGAGGTVTQATSKSTAVTLNKPCGQITMHNAALAAGGVVSFLIGNSLVKEKDGVILTINTVGISNTQAYQIWGVVTDGVIYINLLNRSAVSLSEAVQINFQIIKGATS